MSYQDKVLLMHKVEEALKPRMFANLLEEAVGKIQEDLDEFDVTHVAVDADRKEDLLDLYLNAKKVGGKSEKTLVRYRYTIERFLAFSKLPTRSITTEHVRAYFASELDRGIAESTIDGLRQVLSAYFSWLDREKLITRNPMTSIESIHYLKKERLALSYAETDVLKRGCKNKRDIAIVCFLLSTGCRISEVVNLNRDDVDLDNGECVVLGKGNKERTVFMDDISVLMLREYLATRSDNSEPLFINHCKKRMTANGVRHMLTKLSEETGIENVHPHRFRRTMITRLLNRGMPIQEVAIIAGHEKVDTTMRYFSSNKTRIKNSYRIYTA